VKAKANARAKMRVFAGADEGRPVKVSTSGLPRRRPPWGDEIDPAVVSIRIDWGYQLEAVFMLSIGAAEQLAAEIIEKCRVLRDAPIEGRAAPAAPPADPTGRGR
jgi:hypothetical protein